MMKSAGFSSSAVEVGIAAIRGQAEVPLRAEEGVGTQVNCGDGPGLAQLGQPGEEEAAPVGAESPCADDDIAERIGHDRPPEDDGDVG